MTVRDVMQKGNKLINIAISDICYTGIYKEEVTDFRNTSLQLYRIASLRHSLSKRESSSSNTHKNINAMNLLEEEVQEMEHIHN